MAEPATRSRLRRRALLGAAIAAPVAALPLLRPADHGGAHDAYFATLQQALRKAGLFRPTLVIDRERLDHNLARLRAHLPASKAYRIVAKSLPSLELIRYVRRATGSDRIMSFHQPFLNLIARELPDAQLLLGKPMPVGAAERFYARFEGGGFVPSRQLQWLVDSAGRLAQYRELAQARHRASGERLRISFEIDIGLHRGGFATPAELAQALRYLREEPALEFAGLMGYEAHVAKMPALLGGPVRALARAMERYTAFLGAVREVLGAGYDERALTLNAGGSSTYAMYRDDMPCNELAMGSGLLKPSDFDRPTLADHVPAAFIATPVLKALPSTQIAGLEALSGTFATLDPNAARAFYVYGGYWLADPVSPPGLQRNAIWGHSTNQELLNGSAGLQLGVDDFVFLRPHQSESVLLQFGDLAVYDGREIVASWPVFSPIA